MFNIREYKNGICAILLDRVTQIDLPGFFIVIT